MERPESSRIWPLGNKVAGKGCIIPCGRNNIPISMSRVGEDRSKIRRPTLFESFVGSAIGIPNHLSKQIGNECSKLADGEQRFLSSGDSNGQLQHGKCDGPRRASTERPHLISNGWKTNGATKPTPRRPLSSDEDVKEQI